MVKKMFVFDMDGTLLAHGQNQKLSEKTVYALNELERLGYLVVLNTGKSYSMCTEPLEQFNFKYSITSNGQVVMIDQNEIAIGSFNEAQIEFWIDFSKNNNLAIGFQTNAGQYILESDYSNKYAKICFGNLNVPIPEMLRSYDKDRRTQQIWLLGELDNFKYIDGYDYFRWNEYGIDVQLPGVNKGRGLEVLLDYLKLDECVIYSFGDGVNDLEMFAISDYSIALGNANIAVKEKCSHETLSVYDDGVYEFLVKEGIINPL